MYFVLRRSDGFVAVINSGSRAYYADRGGWRRRKVHEPRWAS